VRQRLPVLHEPRVQPVPVGQGDQRLGPVIEVLAQHVMLGALGPVEGEVEEAVGGHDPPDGAQALVDDLDGRVREHAVRVHHGEPAVGQEVQVHVPGQREVGQPGLQAEFGHGVGRGQQDVRGDVDAVVVPRIQVADEQPPGPQVPAADLEHPVAGLEAVPDQVVELHLADLQPRLAGLAADGALVTSRRIRRHHGAVIAQVISVPQPEPDVAPLPARVRQDAAGVAGRIPDLEDQPGAILGGHGPGVTPGRRARRSACSRRAGRASARPGRRPRAPGPS
jgi:hypothetical protein